MKRLIGPAAVFALLVGAALAQDGIRRGTVKKIDAERKTITLTSGGKDEEFLLTDDTKFAGAAGKTLAERLKGLKEGSAVMFKTGTRDGKAVLVGLKVGDPAGQQKAAPPLPKVDVAGIRPLPELGTGKHHGYEGGLYPGGKNEPPKEHLAAGVSLAKQIRPLGPDGKPAADGRMVLLSVGMSNTTQEFSTFKRIADADPDRSPSLVIVNGAQGGMTAVRIKEPDDNAGGTKYWSVVDQRLKAAGVTREQVQVAWIKQADAGPTQGFPKYAQTLRDELRQIVRMMHRRFPHVKTFYLSSRTFAGFARTPLNPEPYAYESGFSVKWLIEEQIEGEPALNFDPAKGPVEAPWLAWGPYLWANGPAKSPGGLSYEEADFAADGTHPSASGQRKVARELLKFFKSDPTAKLWFVRGG